MTTLRSHWPGLLLITAVTVTVSLYFLRVESAYTGGAISAPLDDAWIHMQFARNIARGDGFSYNPGVPTPGSTAPLWTVLLALPALFTEDLMPWALAFSALFLLATVWLTYGFTWWMSRAAWTAVLAGAGVALAGRMVWAGLAGMETTAFAALSVAAVWLYSRDGLRPWNALLFGLASQLRPEGHALFALALALAGVDFVRARQDHGWSRTALLQTFAWPLLVYAATAVPYALFSLATTGKPLPNTFYAKAGQETFFSLRTLRETLAYAWGDNPVALLLVLVGLVPAWRKSRLAVLWLLALPVFTAFVIDFTWHHGRYTMPLIPFQMAVGALGAWWLVQLLKRRGLAPRAAAGLLAALLVIAGVWGLPRWSQMLATNTQEILDIDVALGEWLRDNTPPDALVALDDIGAITYISQRPIVDMNGLVSPEVWPSLQAGIGLQRDQVLTRILSDYQPDFMAAFPLWRWNIATNPAVATELHHVTTPTHTMIFQQDAYVFATAWPYISGVAPETPLDVQFADFFTLLGFDQTANGLTLYWRSDAPAPVAYDVFIHLVDGDGNIVAQTDRQPVNGLAATNVWQPADLIRDPVPFALPDALSPGRYELRLGVYLRETGERLPASTGGDSVLLATISR